MVHNEVPHWARHYARLIMVREAEGKLNWADPSYHRYDCDYHLTVPKGLRHFLSATGVVIFVLVSAIAVASLVAEPTSILPPYFENNDLKSGANDSSR